jgi:zinc transport system substrate-binding protein
MNEMKRSLSAARILCGLVASVFSSALFVHAAFADAKPLLRVMTTTTLLQCAVRDVAGPQADVSVLIPGGSCPGHYDLRPGDALALSRSTALFAHGYEEFVPRLMHMKGSHQTRLCRIQVPGNWLCPSVQSHALAEVECSLSKIDPRHKAEYRSRSASARSRVAATGVAAKRQLRLSGAVGQAVICSDQIADLLRWMGFNVVSTYGRPEDFAPRQMHDLILLGKSRKVRLVVDNLQSGPDAGRQLAEEIGAAQITLSNFPNGFSHTGTWDKCFQDDVRRTISAMRRHGKR